VPGISPANVAQALLPAQADLAQYPKELAGAPPLVFKGGSYVLMLQSFFGKAIFFSFSLLQKTKTARTQSAPPTVFPITEY